MHASFTEKVHKYRVFVRISALGAYLSFGGIGGRLLEDGRLLNFHHFRSHSCSKEDFADERMLASHVHSNSNVEGSSSIFIEVCVCGIKL